jgi:hypothetical protein
MTPADRFFGLAVEIRKTIEATFAQNELRLAVGDAPRSPVFLIGQIGDEPISLHGESGNLILQTAQGTRQTLDYASFGHKTAEQIEPHSLQLKGQNDVTTSSTSESSSNSELERTRGDEEADPQIAGTASAFAEETTGGDSHAVGMGNACREGTSAQDRSSSHGVLDGSVEQTGNCDSSGSSDGSSLAAVSAGNVGYGSGTTSSPEKSNKERAESRGRSEEIESANPGTGEMGIDPATTDRDSQGHAGDERSDAAQGAGGEGNSGGGDATEREGCKTSQEGNRTQEELENADDDTTGRQS